MQLVFIVMAGDEDCVHVDSVWTTEAQANGRLEVLEDVKKDRPGYEAYVIDRILDGVPVE